MEQYDIMKQYTIKDSKKTCEFDLQVFYYDLRKFACILQIRQITT